MTRDIFISYLKNFHFINMHFSCQRNSPDHRKHQQMYHYDMHLNVKNILLQPFIEFKLDGLYWLWYVVMAVIDKDRCCL